MIYALPRVPKLIKEIAVKTQEIDLEIGTVHRIASAGSFIGVSFTFSNPTATFISYPVDWVNYYTDNTLSVVDPLLSWTLSNEGIKRWSEIDSDDPHNVKEKARSFGLSFGASCSIIIGGKRSVATYAKSDGEFTDTELYILENSLKKIHIACFPDRDLTDLERITLYHHSKGTSSKKVAEIMGVGNQTIVQRMVTIRAKLGVKTNIEAVLLADRLNLMRVTNDEVNTRHRK